MRTFAHTYPSPEVDTPHLGETGWTTRPPRDLHEVAARLDEVEHLLHSSGLAAGVSLLKATKASLRSLLGDPDPLPMSLAPALDGSPVLTVSPSDLRRRIAGLSKRGVPLYVAVDNAVTGEVLARLDVTA
jgi:hypothetical protein